MLNQLLVEMDGLDAGGSLGMRDPVFVLCATNRPDALDPAITRPGRLDQLIRIPLPDEAGRRQVLAAALKRCPLAADVDLETLAAGSEGMSGADLAELCRRAGRAAVRELIAAEEDVLRQGASRVVPGGDGGAAAVLRQAQLVGAMEGMRRSVSAAQAEAYEAMEVRLQAGGATEEQEEGEGEMGSAINLAPEQQQLVTELFQHTLHGRYEAKVKGLQGRISQLESALRAAGLELPSTADELMVGME